MNGSYRHTPACSFLGIARALTLAGSLALSACVTAGTPYQADLPSQNIAGGYSEARLAPDRYRVTFSAVPSTPWKNLERGVVMRAAQLTRATGHRWFQMGAAVRSDHVFVDLSSGGTRRARYSGDYDRWRTYWRLFRYRFSLQSIPGDPLWYSGREAGRSERREITAEIHMGRELPAPPHSFDPDIVLPLKR